MSGGGASNYTMSVDSSTFKLILRYYVIIGVGLGLLGMILMSQFGGGEGLGGSLAGGFLLIVIMFFAVLVGPIISALMGYITSTRNSSAITSGISTGIGAVVFTFIVILLLIVGLGIAGGGTGGGTNADISASSGDSTQMGQNLLLIFIIAIPNALVGAGITLFSGDTILNRPQTNRSNKKVDETHTRSSSNYKLPTFSNSNEVSNTPKPAEPDNEVSNTPEPIESGIQLVGVSVDKSTDSVTTNAIIEYDVQNPRTIEVDIRLIVDDNIINRYTTERQLSANGNEAVRPILARPDQMTPRQESLYEDSDFKIEFLIDGDTKASVTEF